MIEHTCRSQYCTEGPRRQRDRQAILNVGIATAHACNVASVSTKKLGNWLFTVEEEKLVIIISKPCYDETLVFSTFFCFFKVGELRYRFSDMPGSPVSKTGREKIGWLLLKLRTGGDVYPGKLRLCIYI